ncbi:hypothetical protein FIV42_10435 [Persicimonas caeni]|uniref:Uncharacterized protein n=1 Tax=Persicimonas caeni TaxID=2292766 RepID=A0A4Y6PSY7_PERCE|nr:hypothetical protein [Persicimonas caeni]QDG51137.1 hypothetical protein FIV42_10435 [Persicimonas caeni]QED32358.1 hypothetical protein FRD00_10430 [Persicimonas caeni]
MGSELRIDWREPDAVRQVRKASLTAQMGRSSARLVVGVIVLCAVAWAVHRLWYAHVDVPWLQIILPLRVEVCSLNALSVMVAWMAATTVIFLLVVSSV